MENLEGMDDLDLDIDDDIDISAPVATIEYKKPHTATLKFELLKKCKHKTNILKEEASDYDNSEDLDPKPIWDIFYTTSVDERYDEKQRYINEFKVLKTIGTGAYSKVKHVIREYMKDGQLWEKDFALKIMHKPTLNRDRWALYTKEGELVMSNALEKVLTEINIWSRIKHPNIVQLYELIEQHDHDDLYLVIEFCHLGQISDWSESDKIYTRNSKIFDYIIDTHFKGKSFANENEKLESVARIIFRDAMKGLEYLHSNNFAHRDIKLDNILVSTNDGKAKLGDYSVSCEITWPEERLMNGEGTVAYMAPESHSPGSDGFLVLPTDIWSMGVTLYSYITGKLPFFAETEYLMQSKAESEDVPKIDNASEELNDLISRMLSKKPEERPTAKEVLDHKWFNM